MYLLNRIETQPIKDNTLNIILFLSMRKNFIRMISKLEDTPYVSYITLSIIKELKVQKD